MYAPKTNKIYAGWRSAAAALRIIYLKTNIYMRTSAVDN